jgi:O-antigen/teichoic acid export membrane protein
MRTIRTTAEGTTEPEPDVLATPAAGPAALRGSALRTGAYLVGIALSLASAPLLVRHLGIAEFGRYITVASLMNLVTGVTEGGLTAIALREYATLEAQRRAEVMRSLLGVRLALSTAGVGVGIAFALIAGYDSPLVVGAIGAGFGVVLQAFQALLTVPLQAELRFGWTAMLDLLRQVVMVVLIVIGVAAGAGIVPFLWVSVPAGVLVLAVTVPLVRGRTPLRPGLRSREVWWPLVRDTLPYTLAVALNVVYFRLTILIMSLIASDLETGYVGTSVRVVEILLVLPPVVIGAAYPILARAARDDPERYGYAMKRILDLGVIFGAWLAMNVVVGAELAIHVLAGPDGAPAVPVLRIQGLALLATSLGVAAGYGLLSLRRHGSLLLSNGVAIAVVVVLTLVLVPDSGAKGAALAALIAESVLTVVQVAAFLRGRLSLGAGLLGAPVTLGAAGAGVLAWWLLGAPEVGGLVAANAIFVLGLLVTGRFPPEVADALRRPKR